MPTEVPIVSSSTANCQEIWLARADERPFVRVRLRQRRTRTPRGHRGHRRGQHRRGAVLRRGHRDPGRGRRARPGVRLPRRRGALRADRHRRQHRRAGRSGPALGADPVQRYRTRDPRRGRRRGPGLRRHADRTAQPRRHHGPCRTGTRGHRTRRRTPFAAAHRHPDAVHRERPGVEPVCRRRIRRPRPRTGPAGPRRRVADRQRGRRPAARASVR